MITEKAPLALSKLTCQMPDYNKILQFAKPKRRENLYKAFVQKFLSYIQINYKNSTKIRLFGNFTDQAFGFFPTRTVSERKSKIAQTVLLANPASSILLVDDNKPFMADSLSDQIDRLAVQILIQYPLIAGLRQQDGELKAISSYNKDLARKSSLYIKMLGTFNQSMVVVSLEDKINTFLNQAGYVYAYWQVPRGKATFTAKICEEDDNQFKKVTKECNENGYSLKSMAIDNFTILASLELQLSLPKLS